jgi:hypothetical protein
LKTLFLLHVFEECLSLTQSLSLFLQGKQVQFGSACLRVKFTAATLSNMRTDDQFDQLFSAVNAECVSRAMIGVQGVTQTKKPTRVAKMPKTLDSCFVMSSLGQRSVESAQMGGANECEYLRRTYFEIIDRMTDEIGRRFIHNDPVLQSCDTLQPGSNAFMKFDAMLPLVELYSYLDFDVERLNSEVAVAGDMMAKMKVESATEIVTCIADMVIAFPNLFKFCQLVLTLPVSSASAERSFSTLKRVKTYLRSSMTDNRLNHLCLLSSERELSQ